MKFDEVIINENKLGDWMFGDKRSRGKGAGGTGGPKTTAPSLGLKGGLTKLDRLAYKYFVRDFVSDALSTIDSGLRAGLINPPSSQMNVDQTNDQPDGQALAELNRVFESIIEQSQGTDVETSGGRLLSVFLKDWFGQWMQNVDYTKSKDVLYHIIDNLEHAYNNSENPSKPNIDRQILTQLADGAWAATSTVGVTPKGPKNADGAEIIQKSIQAKGAKEPELKSKETDNNQVRVNDANVVQNIPVGVTIKDAGGKETSYNGKQWVNSTGTVLPKGMQEKYSKMYFMDPKPFYSPEDKAQDLSNLKESKTQSAIRAEKIPSLKTR